MKYLPKTYKNQTNLPIQTYYKIISEMVEYQYQPHTKLHTEVVLTFLSNVQCGLELENK